MNIWIEPTLSRRHGTSAAACVADFGGPRVVSWFERFGGIQTLHKEHQEIAGRSSLVVAFSGVWKVTHKYMHWISDDMYIYICMYVCHDVLEIMLMWSRLTCLEWFLAYRSIKLILLYRPWRCTYVSIYVCKYIYIYNFTFIYTPLSLTIHSFYRIQEKHIKSILHHYQP